MDVWRRRKTKRGCDEVGIECNDKSERVVGQLSTNVTFTMGKIEGKNPDMPSDLTLAEQSERRRKEYLEAMGSSERRRGEEQVREVERVLLKNVLSYDEEGGRLNSTRKKRRKKGRKSKSTAARKTCRSRIKRRGCTRWKFSREREICLNTLKSG